MDALATFAALTGQRLAGNAGPDSFNVLPALLGEEGAKGREHLVLQNNGPSPLALREGDWALIQRGGSPRAAGGNGAAEPGAELYNLAKDLTQTDNLANREPAWVKTMTARLEQLREQGYSRPGFSAGGKPPNVVLIVSDGRGWSDYGFMGHPAIETPHLDKLASQSLVSTRGYVTAPLCSPSLASILTGLHPHQHQITGNDPRPGEGEDRTSNTRVWTAERRQKRNEMIRHFAVLPTLPKLLASLGYRSLQTGKWWMGHYASGGFTHGMTHGDMARGARHGDQGLKIGRETMQPIYDFIDAAADRPFLIWYAPLLPHDPFNPPDRLEKKYLGKTSSVHLARYWANCEWFDETCGALLRHLDERGLSQNTIVVYVCDNGWIQHPEHRLNADRSKSSPYEGGVRTPIMIRWPGHATPARNEVTPVSTVDIVPTILRACGLTPSKDMQGIDLLDGSALRSRPAVFGANYLHDIVDLHQPMLSLKETYVIAGEWKLIQPNAADGTGRKSELYRVGVDPLEKVNLAGADPERVARLSELIEQWLKGCGVSQ